jgi:hypothetical protein
VSYFKKNNHYIMIKLLPNEIIGARRILKIVLS